MIDSISKRSSCIGVGTPFRLLPFPDDMIGQEDRGSLVFWYLGISVEEDIEGIGEIVDPSIMILKMKLSISSLQNDTGVFFLRCVRLTENINNDVDILSITPIRSIR